MPIVSVPLECTYILQTPEHAPPDPLIAITLHGYGSDPETMLRLTRALLGPAPIIAALQAPNQQFHDLPLRGPEGKTGYNWGIPKHAAANVRLHHALLNRVIAELKAPRERLLLIGFSQPVSFNYRYAGTFPGKIGGILGLCGGVPGDWEIGAYENFATPILHIARSEDEAYPAEVAGKFPDRLRLRAEDVEFHMIPGAHRFPSKAGSLVEPWLRRVFHESFNSGAQ